MVAEEEGFEPPDESPHQRFSRPPHSTALPLLRAGIPLSGENAILEPLFHATDAAFICRLQIAPLFLVQLPR